MITEYDDWSATAVLACLELTATEAESLAREAERMRGLFLTMGEADIDKLEPTTHALASGNCVREDVSHSFSATEDLLAASPETEDNFFLIPHVL